MAENVLETRIMLRYGTYSQWMNSNTILKTGEAAVCSFPNSYTIESTDSQPDYTPPAVGIKIGDGRHYFRELPWVQAIAADVYNWAKQTSKPIYTAEEIQGLYDYVQNNAPGGGGSTGPVTIVPRIYELTQGTGNDANKYFLRYKEGNENGNWITDTSHFIDVDDFVKVANWIGESDLSEYPDLTSKVADLLLLILADYNYNDYVVDHQFITSVRQSEGYISVTRAQPDFTDISGYVEVEQGGTGATSFPANEVLIGNNSSPISTRPIADEITNNNHLVPNYLVKQYVDSSVAGLARAMHFIGEATVEITHNSSTNPSIQDYNFSTAQPGDVILFDEKEFVWNGHAWILLGDEGSYAIKGSIKDDDIHPDANIAQSKIANLTTDLNSKVDKIEGKGLSSNDYTTEEKQKLADIEDAAQVNLIEHIFVNDREQMPTVINNLEKSIALSIDVFDEEHANKLDGIQAGAQVNIIEHFFLNGSEIFPTTVNGFAKSINLLLTLFTEAEKTKLQNIEAEAQVNKIESITINGTTYQPNQNKVIDITIDQAALNLNVLEGAKYLVSTGVYQDIDIDNKKLILSEIAATGNVKALQQTADTYITLDCGSSTEVI